MKTTILRITRHSADQQKLESLKKAYGNVEIVELDLHYGYDPVVAVKAAVEEKNAAVLEPTGPFPVLKKLAQSVSDGELSVEMIRGQLARDPETGRVKVIGQEPGGRDILGFSHYERVLGVNKDTESEDFGELLTESL